ncbi:MAG: thiamine pyrophosphate-dependent dehydrogenase E1 component subunit alpha [Anaerolineales bacterium]|jgi:TPP-dependent pyruvate/acetoin dehydrogenase alpha subunit
MSTKQMESAVPGPEELNIQQQDALEMYRKMHRIRFFELAAGKLYQKGQVKGGIHAYIGQEAVAVGVCANLRAEDIITSTHRGHGHHIAKGAALNRLMAEVLGKETGYCHGRGGSMHVAAFEVGSLGAFPIVASGVPSAVGAALSGRLFGRDIVVVAFFGDGALAQGTLHESLNLAAIWNLPVIFVCENNRYAVSTRVETSVAFKDLRLLAEAYGMAGEQVDGQNLPRVYAAAQRAVERGRAGQGPSLIHALTYRFEGHYFGEPQIYRTREEVQQAREAMDPIPIFQDYLIEHNLARPEELEAIRDQAEQQVETALEFAENSPDPKPEEYDRYVYA